MRSLKILVLTAFVASASAAGGGPSLSLEVRAQQALGTERESERAGAIAWLRAAGYPGIDAVIAENEKNPSTNFAAVLDQVCQQFDCASSKLFWHTSLEEAKSAAASQQKPILSLRLLGQLDEELTCANSRFFRATLYPNEKIAATLRNDFILHWETVRDVPKVKIDFGDGRTLERTLTGNSIHYVLDSQGRPVDGIPGLYGPQAFLAQITRAAELAQKTARLEGDARLKVLAQHHGKRMEAILGAWNKDLTKIGAAPKVLEKDLAARRKQLEKASEGHWDEIAARHANDAQLDDASKDASRKMLPPSAWDAGQLAPTKAAVENPMLRQFDVLERSLRLDGTQNEFLRHSTLHDWFRTGDVGDVSMLNESVYRHLFLMPLEDPWLGLSPRDSFSGITADGRSSR